MYSDMMTLLSHPKRVMMVTALAVGMTFSVPGAGFAQDPSVEELRALIYYLEHDDPRSVQAEMRRLRAAFPRWTPPSDLNELRALGQQQSAGVDERPIWARIQRNDFAGARALIDQGRASSPSWTPSAELLRTLELNESQAAFEQAYSARDLSGAIAAVRRTPTLMRCDRINNAWRLAELYQAASQNSNALTTYRGVVTSCSRLSDVTATLEKANDVASNEELTGLFDIARRNSPGSRAQLDQLETRLRAGRGQRPRAGATAAPQAAETAPRATAPSTPRPRAQAPAAPAATAEAPVPSNSVPAANMPVRGDRRISRVRALKEQGNWAGCLAASANPQSLDVLYERSWCSYNLERGGEALAGFTATARRANALGGNVPRDSRFGMILSYLSMNMTEDAARLAAATNLTRTQRVEVESTILDQRGVRAYHQREFVQSIAYLNALEQLNGNLRRDLAMLRAYAYLNSDQHDQALAEFTRLNDELATNETRAALQSIRNIMSN